MVRFLSILLLTGSVLSVVALPADACWRCRHQGYASGGYAASGVQTVQTVPTVQAVQTFPTISAVAAMPMVAAATPLALQTYGGVQFAGSGVQVAGTAQGTCGVASSDVQASVAEVQQEIQALRGEFLGSLFRELLLPIANELIRSRLELPRQDEKHCGSGAASPGQGRTGVPQPGGPFGSTAVASASSDDMARLLAKLEELVDLMKREHAGEDGGEHGGEHGGEFGAGGKCEKCQKCEKCGGGSSGESELLPSGDKVSGSGASAGLLVGHRAAVEEGDRGRAGGTVPTGGRLEAKLQGLERKNRELLQRLEAVLPD